MQGFQGARENGHKRIVNMGTKRILSWEQGNKSCVSDILGNMEH